MSSVSQFTYEHRMASHSIMLVRESGAPILRIAPRGLSSVWFLYTVSSTPLEI